MSLPIEDEALEPMEPALPMLPLPDAALLPGELLAWLPLDDMRLPDRLFAEPALEALPPLDRESLFKLLLCAFDEPMLPEPLDPILPLPATLGEPLLDWEPLAPFCVESLPMLLPVASFDF